MLWLSMKLFHRACADTPVFPGQRSALSRVTGARPGELWQSLSVSYRGVNFCIDIDSWQNKYLREWPRYADLNGASDLLRNVGTNKKHQSHDDLVWLSRVKGYHLRFDPESLLNPVPHTCKICFNRRTADTDSVSISKKNVITTRSGRQVNPPKKLCLWLFMSLLFINSLLFNYLLCAFIIYPFIHPLFISCISAVHVILWYCCIYKCILYYKCVCACACVGVCRSEF